MQADEPAQPSKSVEAPYKYSEVDYNHHNYDYTSSGKSGEDMAGQLREALENLKKDANKPDVGNDPSTPPKDSHQLAKSIDEIALVNQVLNLVQISKSNADVITQAFRFVRLDAHLSTLLSQVRLRARVSFYVFSFHHCTLGWIPRKFH